MPQHRGYLLGRLFAFLATQEVFEQPVEQLYQQASVAPPQVFPKALAAMITTGKEELLFPLLKQLPLDAFDGPLNRREQGAFALGYAHERTGCPMPSLEEEHDDEEQGLTERYEFRLDPQLKEWVKTQGGGSFIRAILRNERLKAAQAVTAELSPGGESKP
jgi:hypothetical protein